MRVIPLLICVFLTASLAAAQEGDTNGPATIISFTTDTPFLPLDQVEEGEREVTVSWTAVGLNEDERLILQRYEVSTFVSMMEEGENSLPAQGTREIEVTSPATFTPPMYRLAILDFRNRVIDQRIVTIPYVTSAQAEPTIDVFAAAVDSVSSIELERGTARVAVTWVIDNRPPTSNPIFEQVLPGGAMVNVELPRGVLWVPSAGTGVVAPTLPDGSDEVVLRVRLVDLVDGTVYAEQELQIAIDGAQTATQDTATDEATNEATAQIGGATIVNFSAVAQEVSLGDAVQLLWDVQDAASVEIAVSLPDSEALQVLASNLPLRAGLTIPLNAESFGDMETATFTLRAKAANGEILNTETVEVTIRGEEAQG